MILITGFEPFDSAAVNPSREAVKLLPDTINNEKIEKLQLPVVFGEAAEKVLESIKDETPTAIIMTGVASGRDKITPEVSAIHSADERIPDNAGNVPKWERIIDDAPDGLFSTLPVKRITEAMEAAGFKAGLSYSAGTYVCNDTFFRVCHHMRNTAPNVPCGLIHVPNPKGMDKGTDMTVEDFAKALEICIKAIL